MVSIMFPQVLWVLIIYAVPVAAFVRITWTASHLGHVKVVYSQLCTPIQLNDFFGISPMILDFVSW